MIQINTSKYVLNWNVNNARRGLLYQWIGFLKVKTFVVCNDINILLNMKDKAKKVEMSDREYQDLMREVNEQNED